MKIKHYILLTTIMFWACLGCTKQQENAEVKITRQNVEAGKDVAVFSWSVSYPQNIVSEVELCLNEEMDGAERYGVEEEPNDKKYQVTVDGLNGRTTYYYRFLVWSSNQNNQPYVSGTYNFTTLTDEPKVTTSPVCSISWNSAVCGGNVIANHSDEVKECGVCWSRNHEPTINGDHAVSGSGIGNFVSEIQGLVPNTKYYVRAYAKNETSVSYGEEIMFTTIEAEQPEIKTGEVKMIINVMAMGSGEVVFDGGVPIVERGLCWSTHHYPDINDSKAVDGVGLGDFCLFLKELTSNTTYYIRAYAKNSAGIMVYGNEVSFTTLEDPLIPTGSINGTYSISISKKTYFSKGNLQYKASSRIWRFAEHQYDMIGSGNSSISSSYSGWIDLFGWGTSGWNCGNTYYRPYDSYNNSSGNSLYGPVEHDLTANYANSDWGVYNAISNGGGQAGLWRTVSSSEWTYLLERRTTMSGQRFAFATVANVCGLILLPDDWDPLIYYLNNTNNSEATFDSNVISSTDWKIFEAYGAVFLPAAGRRNGTTFGYDNNGFYWMPEYMTSNAACCLHFLDGQLQNTTYSKCIGMCVRLIHSNE